MLEALFAAGAVQRMARINNAATSLGAEASRMAEDTRRDSEGLRFDIEKLFMITQALWTLLKEQHGYSDDDLIARIQQIDLQDGRLDGKVARTRVNPDCPQCGRKLIGKHPVCLYCGTEVALDPFDR